MGQRISCGILKGNQSNIIGKEYHTTEKLKDIMYVFFLDYNDVQKIFKFFNELDKNNTYIISFNFSVV